MRLATTRLSEGGRDVPVAMSRRGEVAVESASCTLVSISEVDDGAVRWK